MIGRFFGWIYFRLSGWRPEGQRPPYDKCVIIAAHHIAREAKVPIVLGYLDYSRKRGGYGKAVYPSGDVVADMEQIRAFYRAEMAKFPALFTVPRLREESPADEVAATPSSVG